MATLCNTIGGERRPAISGRVIDDIGPATGRVIATIPRSGPEDVAAAVSAAQAAMAGPWGRTTTAERADLCEAIADAIEARLDELAALESRDQGKPVSLARRVDIPRAVANFRFFAGAVRHQAEGFHEMAAAFNYTLRRPVGVVGLITPWNLPLYLLTWKTAPALAMGNAIVAKPSELTPMTASVLADILHEVGLPPGVFNLVHGLGAEVGQAIVEHPDVRAISFTGGTATGARVASSAAPHFKKVSLELGGKNPTVVFADADFDAAVDGAARAGFANQGEICLCGSRILVQAPIAEAFTEALVAKVAALRVGDPSARDTDTGALVSAAHREKVEGYLSLAVEEGGTIRCGGKRPDLPAPHDTGFFLQPAVVTGLAPTCRTATEEIFGPVATVHTFETEEEAIAMANGVRYGLSASVWTRDLGRAHRVSAALETGMVWVNTWLLRDLRVPFGGVKDSGVGREGGHHSLEFFSETRNVCIHLGGPSRAAVTPRRPVPPPRPADDGAVRTTSAPKPVGPYPHARRYGDLLFLSGMGPRQPGTDAIPGGPIRDGDGNALDYDVEAQTRAVIDNIATVLEASGGTLDDVVDITCFLVDMDRDFATFNRVYREYFTKAAPTRTTVAVDALPTPIAVELKVVARARS